MTYFFITNSSNIETNKHNFVYLGTKSSANYLFCLTVSKQENIKDKYDYIACVAKDTNAINYWINKKIDFIINPFSDMNRYFDSNTINVLKKNKITPVILLNELAKYNKIQTTYFLRNARLFSELCKKHKLPLIIDTGVNAEKRGSLKQEFAVYSFFDYTFEQAKMFNKIVFGDKFEK